MIPTIDKLFLTIDGVVKEFVEKDKPPIPTNRKNVFPYRLAIIKQNYQGTDFQGKDTIPQVSPTQDTPADKLQKGHTILIGSSWFSYMRTLMTVPAYRWWTNIGAQIFNHPDGDKAENIMLPGNFIALDSFTSTHARIVCKDSLQAPSNLNPLVDCWYKKPTEYWMSTKVDKLGNIGLVGMASYVYTPVVKRLSERWCPLIKIELFPSLPFDVTYNGVVEHITGYCIEDGTDIYGHAESRDVPLRLVVDRLVIHPCPEWQLDSKPVIPLP
jgi:hypothetical protein